MSKDADQDSDSDFFDCIEDIDEIGKFYAVALPQDKWTDRKGLIAVDLKDAMKKLKEIKGSRLKVFERIREAEQFAQTPAESLVSPQSKDKTRMRRDVDPFPNVSQRDLNDLRLAIDRGELARVEELVWNNPRHLVNESDFPTVLQVRFRYNAVHECCYRGQAAVLRRVLAILDSAEFWRALHPTVDEETHLARRHRLLDLFLNSPDTGCLETPLHFGAKFGHVECVRALVEHEHTSLEPRNREGRTPADLVCSRCLAAPDRGDRRRGILDVLRGRFVPLVESETGDAKVLPPCDWREYRRLRARGPTALRAFAGPMSAEEAAQFHRLLSRPVRKLARLAAASSPASGLGRSSSSTAAAAAAAAEFEVFAAKLADNEKGHERVGRHLAARMGVPWAEFWPFLGDFADLTSDAGLARLEAHVVSRGAEIEALGPWHYRGGDLDEDGDADDESEEASSLNGGWGASQGSNNSSSGNDGAPAAAAADADASWLSPLSRLFARLTLRSPPPAAPPEDVSFGPPTTPGPPACASSPYRRSGGPRAASTPRRAPPHRHRRSLTGGAGLGRADLHVLRALEPLPAGRLARFPQVRRWRDDVAPTLDYSAADISTPRRRLSWHHAASRAH